MKSVRSTPYAEKKFVSLSLSQPVPHMLEENGHMVVKMPRSHPGLKVQMKVNVEMYKRTRLPLRMGRKLMTKKGRILQIPKIELLCANESPAGVLGVFFGIVTAMEGMVTVKVQVLFYVLRDGGNILS